MLLRALEAGRTVGAAVPGAVGRGGVGGAVEEEAAELRVDVVEAVLGLGAALDVRAGNKDNKTTLKCILEDMRYCA